MNYPLMKPRWYLGKYKIGVLEQIGNKSYAMFLEEGIIGNKKIGYKIVYFGDKVFLYTRNCYKKKRVD